MSEADESVGRMVGEYQRQAIELGAACAMLEPFTHWRRGRGDGERDSVWGEVIKLLILFLLWIPFWDHDQNDGTRPSE